MNNIREKPILFNTPMVRAVLDGIKTETRRLIKPQPCMQLAYISAGFKAGRWGYPPEKAWESWGEQFKHPDSFPKKEAEKLWNPPFCADDVLYVRETFAPLYKDKTSDEIVGYMYKEQTLEEYDAMYPDGKDYYWSGKWKPSIHMPKEAARIWLKVKNVCVERLHEMVLANVLMEGIQEAGSYEETWDLWHQTWDSTIKPTDRPAYGWAANPWVWVVKFERIERRNAV